MWYSLRPSNDMTVANGSRPRTSQTNPQHPRPGVASSTGLPGLRRDASRGGVQEARRRRGGVDEEASRKQVSAHEGASPSGLLEVGNNAGTHATEDVRAFNTGCVRRRALLKESASQADQAEGFCTDQFVMFFCFFVPIFIVNILLVYIVMYND